jgi:hypothetical protein
VKPKSPPPEAKCTAIVNLNKNMFGGLRKCGQPATWTKANGDHRCSRHNKGRAATMAASASGG